MSERCRALASSYSAYADDELAGSERARVAAHLESCAACQGDVEALRALRAALGNLPVRAVPADLWDGLDLDAGLSAPRGRAVRRAARPPAARLLRGGVRLLAGSLAAFAVVAGAAFALGGQDPAPTVAVPVDVYVANHLVRTTDGPVPTQLLVQDRR